MKLSIEDHLKDKPTKILETANSIIEKVSKFGNIDIDPIKTAIQFRAGATFLSLKVKNDRCELEFQLSYEIDDFYYVKKVKVSNNRFFYLIYIDELSDVNELLLNWLKKAYLLISYI